MQKKENDTTDRELTISRLLNAPVELLWEVWTNADHIKNWWAPNGFTNTISKMDTRENGEWELVMHGPDGKDYRNKSIFKEIIRHKKIVYEHISAPKFLASISFEAQGEKTLLTWQMLFETKEQFIQVVKTFKADEGLKQNIDKLAIYLDGINHKPHHDSKRISFSRVYNAPIEMVWKAITDGDEMKQWYFDFSGAFKLEEGHEFEWYAGEPEGKQWLHRGKMVDIIDGKKLSHTWEYPGYTGSSLVTWELTAVDKNNTSLVLTQEFITPFDENEEALRRENFNTGWKHIINTSLAEHLKKQS
jgi:uncharacterized protein YndB with AHSA1/START domain